MRISLWKEDLGVVGVVGLAFAAALILGGIDRRSAEVTAKHERAAYEKKANVKPADVVWMRLPLDCDATVSKRGAGEHRATRCYAMAAK